MANTTVVHDGDLDVVKLLKLSDDPLQTSTVDFASSVEVVT